MIADHGVRFGLSLFVGLWVARHLGPRLYGELQFLLALVGLVAVMGEAGLEAVVKRQLIARPADASKILAEAVRIRLIGTGGSLVALSLMAWVMDFRGEALAVLVVAAITVLQPLLTVPELWLMARLAGKDVAWPRWVAIVTGALARIGCILVDAPLIAFVAVIAAEVVLGACLVAWRAHHLGMRWAWSSASRSSMFQTIKAAAPLLLSGVAVVVYARIDVVMLKYWRDGTEVGVYAAAVRLSELAYVLPGILVASLLPALLRAKEQSLAHYRERFQRYFDLNTTLAYLIAGVISVLAGPLVSWAFGADYGAAAAVLRVHAWALPFVFLGVARTQFLIDANLGWFYFGATAGGAVFNIVLNLWLIPEHGAMGAAIATVISYAVASWLSSWMHPLVRQIAWAQTKSLAVPLLGWRYFKRSGN
jgi:PST family polysaccharide transporter